MTPPFGAGRPADDAPPPIEEPPRDKLLWKLQDTAAQVGLELKDNQAAALADTVLCFTPDPTPSPYAIA